MKKHLLSALLLSALGACAPVLAAPDKAAKEEKSESRKDEKKSDAKKDDEKKSDEKKEDDRDKEKLKKEAEAYTKKMKEEPKKKLWEIVTKGSDTELTATGLKPETVTALKEARPSLKGWEDILATESLGKPVMKELTDYGSSSKFTKSIEDELKAKEKSEKERDREKKKESREREQKREKDKDNS